MYMETITGDRNKKNSCLQVLASILPCCLLCHSSVINPSPVTHLPCDVRNPLSHCPDRVLHVVLRVTGHCLHGCPGEIHHRQIIESMWRQERVNPWPPSSLLRWSLTPDRPFSTRFRNPFLAWFLAPRQAMTLAGREGSAYQGCHGGFALLVDVCAFCAGSMGCWWPKILVTACSPLGPFPCSPALFQFCSSPINSSIKFIWKGGGSLLPLQHLFQYCIPGGT